MQEDAQSWGLLQELFHLADSLPETDRRRRLLEHCGDPTLVERALALLESSLELDSTPQSESPVQAGSKVGPYTQIRLLGSGGIGSVWLAERILGGIPQRVALKMLAPHAVGPSFVERFHREQHILQSLDHPHIPRMIDAGISADGHPYLVMEYVEGEHLDTWCQKRKLTVNERLRLFLQVCEAVAYAHRNLIVHLDLKPSNILVSSEGSVKLLDFGTSKLIVADGGMTTTVLATPAYASPEQLRNEVVTTACDVYALGAVLFELLAGRRPYATSSIAVMMERAAAEEKPEDLLDALSADAANSRGVSLQRLRETLRGDLQTIVAKCLQMRPAERYASVDLLAQDVARYLEGEPVLARRQTAIYHLRKYVRRHRVGVASATAAVVVLAGSVGYAVWRQHQALVAARRAEQMQTFMHQLFRLANSYYTGKPAVTVPEFLQLGVKILPDYIHDPDDLLQAKLAMAESMYDNGGLGDAEGIFKQVAADAHQRNDANAEADADAYAGQIAYNMGDSAAGDKLTTEAVQLSRRSGVSPAVRVRTADAFAWNHEFDGNYTDECLKLMRFAADEARRSNLPLHEKADAIHVLASALVYRGLLDEAEPLETEALGLLKQDPGSLCDQAQVLEELANAKELKLDFPAALVLFQRSYDGYSACSGADGRETIAALAYMQNVRIEMGQAQDAVQTLEHWRGAWLKVPDPYGRWSIYSLTLAKGYLATGRYKEAEAMIQAMARDRDLHAWQYFYMEYLWAESLAKQQRYEEALAHVQRAIADWEMVPKMIVIAPGGYRKFAGVKPLLAEIQEHLSASKHAAAATDLNAN